MPVSIVHSRKGPINFSDFPATVRVGNELVTIPPHSTHVMTPAQRAAENVRGEEGGTFSNVLDVVKGVGKAALTGFAAGIAAAAAPTFGAFAGTIGATVLSSAQQRKQQEAAEAEAQQFISAFNQQPQGGSMNGFGIDLGGLLNTGLQQLGGLLQARMLRSSASVAMPGGAPLMAAAPQISAMGMLPSIGQGIGRLIGGVGGAVAASVGVVRSVGGKILRVILPSGVKVSRQAARKLIDAVGFTAAASALGIGVNELAEWMVQDGAKRRGRGVTAAQVRTTRRTMRTVMGLHRQIVSACSSARVPSRRRSSSPVVFAKRCK